MVVLRFIFYKIIVKIYAFYLSWMRRLGWTGTSSKAFEFIFDQKLVHFMVVAIAVILVFTNFSATTRAQSLSETGQKNILSSLVQSEFGALDQDQLIEEFAQENFFDVPSHQSYLDTLSLVREQPIAQMEPSEIDGEFVEEPLNEDLAAVRPGTSPGKTKQTRTETVAYTVEPGDTISTIAEKFEVGVNTILWENNLSAYSLIRPGDTLNILPVSGVTHKVAGGESLKSLAFKYEVSEEEIASANSLAVGGRLLSGQKLIIPGGRKESYSSFKPKTYSGLSVVKGLVKPIKDLIKPPAAKPTSGNKMNWPTSGYRISQYFTWRHFGIDVANKIGTPLYAADSGVVEYSGWSNGYGNNVVINHGGGKKTRYAHASKLYSRVGEKVSKGQAVAAMGSTGWSTGSHIHFEIMINGVKYNPLNYVK